MHLKLHLVFLACAIAGNAGIMAAPSAAPQPPPKITIWIGHTFIGGPKCVMAGPVSHFQAPGFANEKAKLLRLGIRPEREFFRDMATCEACHKCANYHREILFEIVEEQLERADKAGYRKVTPPGYDELKEYEDGKRFKPKPDRGPRDD